MAQKKCYVYRIEMGNNNIVKETVYGMARNAGYMIAFCQERYKDKHYDSFKAIKVGLSKVLRDTFIMEGMEEWQIKQTLASRAELFAEREDVL